MNKSVFASFAFLGFHAFAVADELAAPQPLLVNGDLSERGGDGWLRGWPKGDHSRSGRMEIRNSCG